ncbi:hypothetical protein RclHR1_02780010 [Rhizophagus clarus]|uniref:Uncharacterized protein n=1 Tax=Rhizophagus clarus TaxID=94130 RepID=A0A2Z6R2A1_9GLOM|nr:hypothetical protein RclHR1_02780010 [Rhizophagus clarus]
MENFEKNWSKTITELIKTFEDELIQDLGQLYPVTLGGRPMKESKQYKKLAYLVGEQNLFQYNDPQRSDNYRGCIRDHPPVVTLPAAKSKKGKEKQGSIQKVTCDNNIVYESQNRQRRTIMVYDVPTKWSPDKYYTIRVDIVLNLTKDTEFILMSWCTQLEGIWVWWFSGEWKLAQRKSREVFQASFRFPADTTEDAIYSKFTPNGESLLQYTRAAAWKVIKDKQGLKGILYFETHERLMRALTLQTDKIKLTNSRTPLPIKSKKIKHNKSDSTQKTRQSKPSNRARFALTIRSPKPKRTSLVKRPQFQMTYARFSNL